MIVWYEDNELGICFNHKPNTDMLDPEDGKTNKEKETIAKYPFINNTALIVELFDDIKEQGYGFTVPKNFRWDGATIKPIFWLLIGSKTDPRFKNPSMIHDYICNNKYIVNFDRNFSSRVFRAMLLKAGVSRFKAQIMYLAVDIYQRFCGWGK